jgi:predicted adenine nucleotide alpha hydrolase (AANH) superfamily ATPase
MNDKNKQKKNFLLHCCCAPCGSHPLNLLRENYNVTFFFYNPNIQPEDEYKIREQEIKRMAIKWNVPLISSSYDLTEWLEEVKGYEQNPEGEFRCEICYRIRMEKTASTAYKNNYDIFGTTLSISPHKNAVIINRIGREISKTSGIMYYKTDFKKNNGFKISCEISHKENLYRQNYCGCIYSKK